MMRAGAGRRSLAGLLVAALWASIAPGLAVAATATSTQLIVSDIVQVNQTQEIKVGLSPAPDGGSVEIKIDGETFGTQTFSTNYVSFSWTPVATGSYTVQAFYGGTAAYAASQSTAQVVSVIPPPPNSVTVTGTPNPVARNADVTFTATISPNPGPGTVKWTVSELEGVQAETAIDGSGKATFTHAFDTPGHKGVTAVFTGNASYSSRPSDMYYVQVNGDGVTVTVSVPGSPLPPGPVFGSVTLTPNPGAGTLRWKYCEFCTEYETPVDADGTTSLSLGSLSPSQYTLFVRFLGSGNYAEATGQASFTVAYVTSITATTNRTTAYAGELPVVLTATVTAEPSLYSGTVTFIDNVGGNIVNLGPVTLDPYTNKATFSSAGLRVGVHSVTARFNGLPLIRQSTSAPITFTVYADTAVHATFAPNMTTFYPTADGFKDKVRLGGTLNEKATVTIKVINSYGTTKRTWSLGTRNPGAYYVDWGGKTATGVKLPAGKYKVTATIKDAKAHTRTFTAYVTISWRSVTWKSVTVTKYGEAGVYYVGVNGGTIYYSLVYPKGRILDSGEMIRDCTDCGFAAGQFKFQLVTYTTVLGYRNLYIETRGHGFSDREHPGSAGLVDPKTGDLALIHALPEYDQVDVKWGIPFTTAYLNASKQVEAWIWMDQAWGDAWDVNYLRLTYQYAVWAT